MSEGKNDPIYNAHSYHTKVPHKAIMRYILHYTKPGDIVFDGFCGSGMTGVAAQLCGDPDPEFKLKVENEWRAAVRASSWSCRVLMRSSERTRASSSTGLTGLARKSSAPASNAVTRS